MHVEEPAWLWELRFLFSSSCFLFISLVIPVFQLRLRPALTSRSGHGAGRPSQDGPIGALPWDEWTARRSGSLIPPVFLWLPGGCPALEPAWLPAEQVGPGCASAELGARREAWVQLPLPSQCGGLVLKLLLGLSAALGPILLASVYAGFSGFLPSLTSQSPQDQCSPLAFLVLSRSWWPSWCRPSRVQAPLSQTPAGRSFPAPLKRCVAPGGRPCRDAQGM